MPFEKHIIAARFNLQVQDLTATYALAVRCEGCGRGWRVFPAQLLEKYPPYCRVKEVAAGFRCPTCRGGV